MRMLVDQVVKATGAKKKGVKEVVEATLSRIGEALARGDELNLPGFGKVRVVKTDAKDGTAIMTLKLRQGPAGSGQKGLADTGDDD
jgi:nucleoid DNA-binding protein